MNDRNQPRPGLILRDWWRAMLRWHDGTITGAMGQGGPRLVFRSGAWGVEEPGDPSQRLPVSRARAVKLLACQFGLAVFSPGPEIAHAIAEEWVAAAEAAEAAGPPEPLQN